MLKYFSLLFLLFFALSIPSILIYGNGDQYANTKLGFHEWFTFIGLGNMDPATQLMPA
jgi:hypothetical protein